jgi:2-keto-3-deoxy-L-rhamnonate aldolase RhmA
MLYWPTITESESIKILDTTIPREWLQHIERMDTNRQTKEALKYKPKGKRTIGCLRKRWKDQLHPED